MKIYMIVKIIIKNDDDGGSHVKMLPTCQFW